MTNKVPLTLLRWSLSVAVLTVKNVSPDQWAKVGQVVVDWLISIEDRLPPGNPLTVVLSSYKAAPSRLVQGPRQ